MAGPPVSATRSPQRVLEQGLILNNLAIQTFGSNHPTHIKLYQQDYETSNNGNRPSPSPTLQSATPKMRILGQSKIFSNETHQPLVIGRNNIQG